MVSEEVEKPLWKGEAHPLTDTQPASSTYIKSQYMAGQLDAWSQSQSGLKSECQTLKITLSAIGFPVGYFGKNGISHHSIFDFKFLPPLPWVGLGR